MSKQRELFIEASKLYNKRVEDYNRTRKELTDRKALFYEMGKGGEYNRLLEGMDKEHQEFIQASKGIGVC